MVDTSSVAPDWTTVPLPVPPRALWIGDLEGPRLHRGRVCVSIDAIQDQGPRTGLVEASRAGHDSPVGQRRGGIGFDRPSARV